MRIALVLIAGYIVFRIDRFFRRDALDNGIGGYRPVVVFGFPIVGGCVVAAIGGGVCTSLRFRLRRVIGNFSLFEFLVLYRVARLCGNFGLGIAVILILIRIQP